MSCKPIANSKRSARFFVQMSEGQEGAGETVCIAQQSLTAPLGTSKIEWK